MLLGFKTELKINNTQKILLAKHAGVARHAWNWGLSLTKKILDNNRTESEEKIKFPSAIDLHKWLVAILNLFLESGNSYIRSSINSSIIPRKALAPVLRR